MSVSRPGDDTTALTAVCRIPPLLSSDTAARRDQCLVGVAEPSTGGVFSVLASSGLVTVVTPTQDAPRCVLLSLKDFKSSEYSIRCRQFYPVYGICDDFDTFYDELHIYQGRVIVLKIFRNLELGPSKHTLLSVSDLSGSLLWKLKINPVRTR